MRISRRYSQCMSLLREITGKNFWATTCAAQNSLRKRFLVSILISAIGFSLIYFTYESTHYYSTSLTIITIILVALYGGFYLGLGAAITLSLASDYFFFAPVGNVFKSGAVCGHFSITVLLAVFLTYLISTLRTTIHFITEAKEKEESTRQEAVHASIEMENILALVSHDIRNPLSAIKLGCELMLKTPCEAQKQKQIFDHILRSIYQADSMIKSLLDVERLRSGKTIPLDFQTCDLNEEVEKIIQDLSLGDPTRLQYTGDKAVLGYWSVVGIRRALENLVNNAMKYGEPLTPICIRLTRHHDHVILSVHNYGGIISAEDQSKLFQAFQRTSQAESSEVRGWGLGLALVKGIADGHEGTVKVQSDKDFGTQFTLELPIRNPREMASQVASHAS
jgi:signal transduction histidine kinase